MCKLLLKSGADPNIADIDGKTAMHHAMPLGFTGCVRYLAMHSCRAATAMIKKLTKAPQVVSLYNNGADDTLKCRAGFTASDYTLKFGNTY
jgi:ankyrin repeat protein